MGYFTGPATMRQDRGLCLPERMNIIDIHWIRVMEINRVTRPGK